MKYNANISNFISSLLIISNNTTLPDNNGILFRLFILPNATVYTFDKTKFNMLKSEKSIEYMINKLTNISLLKTSQLKTLISKPLRRVFNADQILEKKRKLQSIKSN